MCGSSRLAAASRKFLGRTLARAPWLPRHFADSFAGGEAPLAWEVPESAFGRAVNQLGRFVTDFIAQSSRVAAALVEAGVTPGDRVGICMRRSPLMIANSMFTA